MTVDDHVVIMLRSMNVGESPGLYDVPGGHPEPEVFILIMSDSLL